MIVLPTRRRLERRRNALYRRLQSVLLDCPVHVVEDIMRQIHGINFKLKTYFIREGQHEPAEFLEEKEALEDEYSFEAKEPTFVQLEEIQREIEI